MENVKGRIFRSQNELLVLLATWGLTSKESATMEFIGTNYSGYWFPRNLVGSAGTIWGVGLGMDSSFELRLGELGYKVIGFEPDSACIERAQNDFVGIDSTIYQFGLWDRNGFFESFGSSISIVNIFENSLGNRDSLDIRDIHQVANFTDLEHQKVPRILKMNIEGAEREILFALISRPLQFEVIIFQAEFLLHLGFFKFMKKLQATLQLRAILRGLSYHGFELVHNYRNQFTLIQRNGFDCTSSLLGLDGEISPP